MPLEHLLPFEGKGAIPFWVRNKRRSFLPVSSSYAIQVSRRGSETLAIRFPPIAKAPAANIRRRRTFTVLAGIRAAFGNGPRSAVTCFDPPTLPQGNLLAAEAPSPKATASACQASGCFYGTEVSLGRNRESIYTVGVGFNRAAQVKYALKRISVPLSPA